MAAAGRRCDVGAFARIKPVIYSTTNGDTIVEDELLNFLLIKSRTLDQDNIIKIVKTSFSSQRIEASKDTMAQLFPDSKRWSAHRGEKKDEIHIKMCLAVFKEKGEELGPRFVSHFLDELPPISFKHVDVSALLGRMQQVNADIELLKTSLNSQATACETLLEVTGSISQRLVVVENTATTVGRGVGSSMNTHLPAPAAPRPAGEDASSSGPELSDSSALAGMAVTEQRRRLLSSRKTPLQESRWSSSGTPGVPPAQGSETAPGNTASPGWSTVARRGLKRAAAPVNPAHRAAKQPRTAATENPAHRAAKHPRKKAGITGTAVINDEKLSTVSTKLVSVFATKFSPDLDADTLRDFLQEKMNREVKCRRIETPLSRFSSFCISAEWNEWKEMYDPQFWPAGSVVRQYYEPRRPRKGAGRPPERIPSGSPVVVSPVNGETSSPVGIITGS